MSPPGAVSAAPSVGRACRREGQPERRYARREQAVEPISGIVKAAFGFPHFQLHGLVNGTAEWALIALACTCRGAHRLRQA